MEKLEAMASYIKELEGDYGKKINKMTAEKKEKDQLITELREMLNKLGKRAEDTALQTSYIYSFKTMSEFSEESRK